MKAALLSGELRKFGLLLHEAGRSRSGFLQKSPMGKIDEMYEAALRNGAVGGKITGAGGGGFLLLFCQQGYQQNVRESLVALGRPRDGFRI